MAENTIKRNDGLTTEPVSAVSELPQFRNTPEFLRPEQVSQYFPMSRTTLYELMKDGKVKSCSVRKKGSPKGMRLISYDSLKGYFNGLVDQQMKKGS